MKTYWGRVGIPPRMLYFGTRLYNILVGNLKVGDHSENLSIDGKMRLQWI